MQPMMHKADAEHTWPAECFWAKLSSQEVCTIYGNDQVEVMQFQLAGAKVLNLTQEPDNTEGLSDKLLDLANAFREAYGNKAILNSGLLWQSTRLGTIVQAYKKLWEMKDDVTLEARIGSCSK